MTRRNSPVLDPVREFIDQIQTKDQKAPRKQRHTARRIYDRLCVERSDHPIAERTVREYVQFWNLANGKARGEIFIPQAYDPGIQAHVDWYEAVVSYLMTTGPINCAPAPLDPAEIKRSEFSTRPLPALTAYDQLLSQSASNVGSKRLDCRE